MKFILALLAGSLAAQQTVTIPAPDGKTITSNAGVWSCTATGLPSGMAFDGTTLVVPAVTASLLTLTGGPNIADGLYLGNFAAGKLTWIPYVPPAVTGGYLKIPATIPALGNMGQGSTTGTINAVVNNPLVTMTSGVSVTIVGPYDPNFHVEWAIPYPGYVAVWARYAAVGPNKDFPGANVIVTVFP